MVLPLIAAPAAQPAGGKARSCSPGRSSGLLADDMGQWAAQPYGNKEIITPTLSSLAANGTMFKNAVRRDDY